MFLHNEHKLLWENILKWQYVRTILFIDAFDIYFNTFFGIFKL